MIMCDNIKLISVNFGLLVAKKCHILQYIKKDLI